MREIKESREEYTNPQRDRKSTLFHAILDRMQEDGCMAVIQPILDYYLPNKGEPLHSEEDTELTDYRFDIVPRMNFGASEGIYVDLYLEGSCDATDRKLARIGCFKTLRTDLDACRLMGELCGMLLYHGRDYVNENIHRYTPKAELEAEYRRYLERKAT